MRDEQPTATRQGTIPERGADGTPSTVRRRVRTRSTRTVEHHAHPQAVEPAQAPRPPASRAAAAFVPDTPLVRAGRPDGSIDLAPSITIVAAGEDPGYRADIWHPGLPDGAVDLVRAELAAGRPACVYAEPPTGDGRSTLALAVLTRVGPGPGDVVVVELTPRNPAAAQPGLVLTRDAFAAEVEARVGGATRAAAAVVGRELLERAARDPRGDLLAIGGRALATELTHRPQTATALYVRTPATGAADEVLRELSALEGDVSALLLQLRPLGGLADDLDGARRRLLSDVTRLNDAAQAASRPVAGLSGPAADEVEQLRPDVVERAGAALGGVESVADLADELRRLGDRLRLRGAVVRLHTLTAAAAVVAAAGGPPAPETGLLIRALRAELEGARQDLAALTSTLATTADRLGSVVGDIDAVRMPLQGWADALCRAGRQSVADVPQRVIGVADLAALAERCRRAPVVQDLDTSMARLDPLTRLTAPRD